MTKPATSRQKGFKWENECARTISQWWTGDETFEAFERSHGSGARHNSRYQTADLSPVSHDSHILTDFVCFECKAVSAASWGGFIYGTHGRTTRRQSNAIIDFYDQAADAAKLGNRNRIPMVLLKENRQYPVMLTDKNSWRQWIEVFCAAKPPFLSIPVCTTRPYIEKWTGHAEYGLAFSAYYMEEVLLHSDPTLLVARHARK